MAFRIKTRGHRSGSQGSEWMDSGWRFHDAEWPGGIRVMVLPRTVGCSVVDSNTGVVLKSSNPAFGLADIVTKGAAEENCDKAALDWILNGGELPPQMRKSA